MEMQKVSSKGFRRGFDYFVIMKVRQGKTIREKLSEVFLGLLFSTYSLGKINDLSMNRTFLKVFFEIFHRRLILNIIWLRNDLVVLSFCEIQSLGHMRERYRILKVSDLEQAAILGFAKSVVTIHSST